MSEVVTENGSAHESAAVVCNNCERRDSGATSRRWLWRSIHCRTCHADDHRACASCGRCMPKNARLDRVYCSSTCRGRARKERERAALERAAWEAEHPEAAAKEAAEAQAWLKAGEAFFAELSSPASRERSKLNADLQAKARVCAKCGAEFRDDDVVYRRRDIPDDVTALVLPYCGSCRCSKSDGYHNRDAPPDRYYPSCRCDDHLWTTPEACVGCGRPVSHPRHAQWRRGHNRWVDVGNGRFDPIWVGPRTFCGSDCKHRVFRVEAKCRRLAAKPADDPRCSVCKKKFTPQRCDARYCSGACRQRAHRDRNAAAASTVVDIPPANQRQAPSESELAA